MTIRSAMFSAAEHTTVAFTRECGGRVRLTAEHLAMDRDELIAEASIGCCQKCGCLGTTVWLEMAGGVKYIVARCNRNPSALSLGDREEPDPGKLP